MERTASPRRWLGDGFFHPEPCATIDTEYSPDPDGESLPQQRYVVDATARSEPEWVHKCYRMSLG